MTRSQPIQSLKSKIQNQSLFAWCLAVLLIFGGTVRPAHAQRGPARVDAVLSADSVTVGEPFTLSITAEHRFGSQIRFPSPDAGPMVFGALEVLDKSDVSDRYLGADGPGLRVDSVAYRMAAFSLDSVRIPSIPVEVIIGGDTVLVRTQPRSLPVIATVGPDENRLRDVTLASFPQPLWPWMLLAIGVLGLAGLLAYWWWSSRQPDSEPDADAPVVPDATPLETVTERFSALQDYAFNGDPKPYYVELSNALRTYLGDRLNVHAMEQTTSELVQRLRSHPDVPNAAAQRIQDVLELADLVKFADTNPPPAESHDALREARYAVAAIEDAHPTPNATTSS